MLELENVQLSNLLIRSPLGSNFDDSFEQKRNNNSFAIINGQRIVSGRVVSYTKRNGSMSGARQRVGALSMEKERKPLPLRSFV